jgi:hypothetical protein
MRPDFRTIALVAAALCAAVPAWAQAQYSVSGVNPGTTAPGVVNLCPTQNGLYVPCGTAGALPLQPGPTPTGANDIGNVSIKGYSFTNITTSTTTVIKAGPGVLHAVCVNTPAATGTFQMYDNTAGSGTKIGLITSFASVSGCFIYDVAFSTGLTVVTATATPDFTVSWR